MTDDEKCSGDWPSSKTPGPHCSYPNVEVLVSPLTRPNFSKFSACTLTVFVAWSLGLPLHGGVEIKIY